MVTLVELPRTTEGVGGVGSNHGDISLPDLGSDPMTCRYARGTVPRSVTETLNPQNIGAFTSVSSDPRTVQGVVRTKSQNR